MSSEQYTPTLDEARGRYSDGAIHQGIPGDHLDAFDRLIAQVRRDAARDALDGLSTWLGDLAEKHPTRTAYVPLVQGNITRYTTDHYPEVTP